MRGRKKAVEPPRAHRPGPGQPSLRRPAVSLSWRLLASVTRNLAVGNSGVMETCDLNSEPESVPKSLMTQSPEAGRRPAPPARPFFMPKAGIRDAQAQGRTGNVELT